MNSDKKIVYKIANFLGIGLQGITYNGLFAEIDKWIEDKDGTISPCCLH